MEMDNLSYRLNDSNPFEAVGSLLSALASETGRANTSGEFYELALRSNELNPADVSESAMALFLECKRILQLPFLSEHNSAVESHQKYLDSLRETFFRMAFSYESMGPLNNFKAAWDTGRWAIMSQSVKSFRNEYQNYELIELVKRYLAVIRQFLVDSERTQTATDALNILDDLLRNLDEELWKYPWEYFESKFAVLDSLLQTESDKAPDSAFSTFYKKTREAIWTYFIRANRVMDVALFIPRAYAVLNVTLALVSDLSLPDGKVEEFMSLMPQLAPPNPDSAQDTTVIDAPPTSPNADGEDAVRN